ncbi:MAG: hypothetical protein QHI48_04640 [Bacteroidota bacterium]|nr:hypothetical protein [Bacteroidota bacterium]
MKKQSLLIPSFPVGAFLDSPREEMNINPIVLEGNSQNGWALDNHIKKSIPTGYDEQGRRTCETTRSDIGECFHRLKYHWERSMVEPIARTVEDFMRSRSELKSVQAFIPVPSSSTARPFQPVFLIAEVVGPMLGVTVPTDYLLKTKVPRR